MKLRHDFGTRVAGQRAKFIDEFITRDQPKAGAGISIVWNGNDDLVISSTVVSGAGGQKLRAIIGRKFAAYTPANGDAGDGRHQTAWTGTDTNALIADGNGHYYNLMRYFDIMHNWNLVDKHNFHLEYYTLKTVNNTKSFTQDDVDVMIRVIPIDQDTIRIYYGLPIFINMPNKWTTNIMFESSTGQFKSEHDLITYSLNEQDTSIYINRIIVFRLLELPKPDVLEFRSNP